MSLAARTLVYELDILSSMRPLQRFVGRRAFEGGIVGVAVVLVFSHVEVSVGVSLVPRNSRDYEGEIVMRRSVAAFIGWVALLAGGPVSAQVGPPALVPSVAAEGQQISMTIATGSCDTFLSYTPVVVIDGATIEITLSGFHQNFNLCNFGPDAHVFQIGGFPAGEYSVHVYRTYQNTFSQIVTQAIGVASLSVAPLAVGVPVPTISALAGIFLALIIVILVTKGKRISRRSTARFQL